MASSTVGAMISNVVFCSMPVSLLLLHNPSLLLHSSGDKISPVGFALHSILDDTQDIAGNEIDRQTRSKAKCQITQEQRHVNAHHAAHRRALVARSGGGGHGQLGL